MGNKGFISDLYSSSGLDQLLYQQKDLKLFYMNLNYDFRAEMFDIMYVWINLMLKNLKLAQ